MAELFCYALPISIALEKYIKAPKVIEWVCVPQQEKPLDLNDQGLIIIRLPVAQKSARLIVLIYVLNLSLGPTL